jgi:hypothetical protein
MKVHSIGFGVLTNHDESLHFTQDNDENLICMETGELMKEVARDENDNIIEINYMTPEEITVNEIFKEAMAKRQPCKSLIEEIMEDIDDLDDDEIGY